jgi:hypothetical protein
VQAAISADVPKLRDIFKTRFALQPRGKGFNNTVLKFDFKKVPFLNELSSSLPASIPLFKFN